MPQHNDLDKQLVYSLSSAALPTWRQLAHLPKILSASERRLFFCGLLGLAAGIVMLGSLFYFNHFIPQPARGGDYTEGLIGAPQYINPLLSQTNDVDADLTRLIFSGLVRYDNTLGLVPDLATHWDISDDKKVYTFYLRPNVAWHNGKPFTADDIIFTAASVQDPNFKSPLIVSFRGVTVEKIDDLTVRFTLPDPYPEFLEVMTVGILPEHIWGEIPPLNANLAEYNLKPIGTGPWKYESLVKDKLGNLKSYTLIANPDYYGEKPYLTKLTFKFYPDFETGVEALQNNSTQGISFLPKELKKKLTGQRDLKLYSLSLPQYTAVFFNTTQNAALKEKAVRQALAESIDRQTILSEALQLEGALIDGPILPLFDEQNQTGGGIAFNPDEANKFLDDANWQRLTPDEYKQWRAQHAPTSTEPINPGTATSSQPEPAGQTVPTSNQPFYRKKGDTILTITLTTVDQPEDVTAVELIKKSWAAIGVVVNTQVIASSKMSREVIKPRHYEALLYGVIVGSNPDPFPFWHSSQVADPGLNLTSFANRQADTLLEDARKVTDVDARRKDYSAFQKILHDEVPAIFLYNPTYTYVISKKIKGFDVERIGSPADRFNNITQWYIKTKRLYRP